VSSVRVGILASAVCLLVALYTAAGAGAWRAPSGSERQAITTAAQGSPRATPEKRVHVSHIRISTVGPWASAVVTIYFGKAPDDAEIVLRKSHGRWRLTAHSPGTEGVACGIGMPHADQRNLGVEVC
jgi:hypothetical protein